MKINTYLVLIIVAVLAVVITVGVVLFSFVDFGGTFSFLNFEPKMSSESVAKQSIEYLNQNILSQQNKTANLVSFSDESGLVKISLEIDGQSFDSYATKDGKLFFPEALELNLNKNK